MKPTFIVAITAAGMLAGGAEARKQDQTIVVQGPLTLSQWTGNVSEKLDRALRYPKPPNGRMFESGMVSVRFKCSENGRPADIKLNRTSRHRDLDFAALQAIGRIKTLHPLPEGLRPDQLYEANILFASSVWDYDRQIAEVKKDADRRNAWFGRDRDVIAINLGSRPPRG